MEFRLRSRMRIYTEMTTQLLEHMMTKVFYGAKRKSRPGIIRSNCQKHRPHQTSFNRRELTTITTAAATRANIP